LNNSTNLEVETDHDHVYVTRIRRFRRVRVIKPNRTRRFESFGF